MEGTCLVPAAPGVTPGKERRTGPVEGFLSTSPPFGRMGKCKGSSSPVRVGPAICLPACLPGGIVLSSEVHAGCSSLHLQWHIGLSHHTSQFLGWLTVSFFNCWISFSLPSRPAGEIQGRGKKATLRKEGCILASPAEHQIHTPVFWSQWNYPGHHLSLFSFPRLLLASSDQPLSRAETNLLSCCWAACRMVSNPASNDSRLPRP
jgi:hypothetical protein